MLASHSQGECKVHMSFSRVAFVTLQLSCTVNYIISKCSVCSISENNANPISHANFALVTHMMSFHSIDSYNIGVINILHKSNFIIDSFNITMIALLKRNLKLTCLRCNTQVHIYIRITCLTAISSEVSILIQEYTVPNFPAPT